MVTVPQNVPDLFLAPVALTLNARIEELAALPIDELPHHVARESDMADWTPEMRAEALVRAVAHFIDLRGWQLDRAECGIAMSHGVHRIVLGVPDTFRRYVAGQLHTAPVNADMPGHRRERSSSPI